MKIKITVVKISNYTSLMEKYELPQKDPCFLNEGDVFYSENGEMPNNFCKTAWETLSPFVDKVLFTDERIYGEWMIDPHSAMVSCNDGFRPVSFYIERVK